MPKNNFLKKIRKKAEQNVLNRKDLRFIKTIALLKGKGLLDTNLNIPGAPQLRIDIQDALWAGKNVEPRILEVLPAALLHYRKNFLNVKPLPKELEEVLTAIRKDVTHGPDFEDTPFDKMKHWANTQLKDKRTKPTKEKKFPKYIRLPMRHLKKLKALVDSGKFKDQTSAIEAAIEQLWS